MKGKAAVNRASASTLRDRKLVKTITAAIAEQTKGAQSHVAPSQEEATPTLLVLIEACSPLGYAKQAHAATFRGGWETWTINRIVPPGLYLVSRLCSHMVDADDDFQTAGLLRVEKELCKLGDFCELLSRGHNGFTPAEYSALCEMRDKAIDDDEQPHVQAKITTNKTQRANKTQQVKTTKNKKQHAKTTKNTRKTAR